jgi:PIN domain nuclease of toxin-antitoxin system
MESADNELLLSIASAWEIAIKVSTGKLTVGTEVGVFLTEQLALNDVSLLPISISALAKMAALPAHHKDPFDRLIIAQSLTESLTLLSVETTFDLYGVRRTW